MRIAQTLPTPTSASTAITTWAGRISATALPTKAASAHVAGRGPARPGRTCASRTATAARPYSVIPKSMPTANELKYGPDDGTGARNRQARNPKRKAPRDVDPVIRRTIVPVSAAAASSISGSTTKWRASSGAMPKSVMTAAPSHASPQWYQVWVGRPSISVKPDGE